MHTTSPPDRSEAAEYYFTYIDKVPPGDIRDILETQRDDTVALLAGITDAESTHRYAPDNWSIRQVVSHLNDTERAFTFRALWFARGFDTPLPGYDQDIAIAGAAADDRSLDSHVAEFQAVRAATLAFFRSVPDDAWMRRGIASGNPFTVHALAYITAGHIIHHVQIVRERYLPGIR
jgi:DinB superfamily